MNSAAELSDIIRATLQAEFGTTGNAHIGLFAAGGSNVADLPGAQDRFVQLLIEKLVQANSEAARILVAGESLQPVVTGLFAHGYSTTWLAGRHVSSTMATNTDSVQIRYATLLDAPWPESFDCVIFVGTYRYLDQLPILNRCRELLKPGGGLFLVGEFLQDDSRIEYSSLANLSSLQQLAERLGLRRIEVRDLTDDAAQSVRLFLPLLQKHTAKLQANSQVNLEEWQDNSEVLQAMLEELESGRRTYQLQHWCLPDPVADTHQAERLGEYADAEYGDIGSFAVPEIQNLFEKSFEKNFDPALWHWKYQLGGGKCIVARTARAGEIVAHYGGAPRKILYFARPAVAIQVCDVMVLPEKRRQYGKSSLFFKAAATFLEREIGNTVNHLLGFGFPNQSAMNIAIRLGLYEKTDDFVEVVFPPADTAGAPMTYAEFDGLNPLHLQHVKELWQEMAPDYSQGIIGMRDAAYIKYRYADHPGAARKQYRCLLASAAGTGKLVGLVVLKQHGDSQLLMDMVCPLVRIPTLISAANQLVKEQQLGASLRLWLTRGWLAAIPLAGAIVNELNIEIPCNSWNPGPAAADLYGKWWLTAGDMDFM